MDRRDDLQTLPPVLTGRTISNHINPSVVFASASDHHRLEQLITIPGRTLLEILHFHVADGA